MTRRAVFFRHMNDDTGGCFPALLRDRGFAVSFVDWQNSKTPDDLSSIDLIVALGGAQQVWQEDKNPWLKEEKEILRDWIGTRAKPYIGLCFGHQLLASSLGGEVAPAKTREIGVCSVSFKQGHEAAVTQWHVAEVTRAPDTATVTASSTACPVQMMTVGDHAYSTQFHHEWDLATVRGWIPLWQTDMDKATGTPGFYANFTKQVAKSQPALSSLTSSLLDRFMTRQGW